MAFKQGQDKHAIKGQASCSNDPFRVTDMLRQSKLPHRILSLSHYFSLCAAVSFSKTMVMGC